MKIRRYKGSNREALYEAIHKEMGPDAIVVTPEGSGSALFGRPRRHELIAILDDAPASALRAPVEDEQRAVLPAMTDDIQRWRRQQNRQWKDLQNVLGDIRKTVETLQAVKGSGQGTSEASVPADYARRWDPRFCRRIQEDHPSQVWENMDRMGALLAGMMPVSSSFSFRHPDRNPHIVVLTGPTGSGKTTTLAKMAAIAALQEKLRVGLVTLDTYRVAAVDQIREYASLLDMELRVAFSAEEARTAIESMSDCDLILVDTPGRTHFDDMGLAMSHKIMKGMGAITVLLTIPAGITPHDLSDVLKGFSRFSPDYLVVTKIDETRHGSILTSLPFETDLKIAFVTNGQRVPQDIMIAKSEILASLLMSGGVSSSKPQLPPKQIPAGIVFPENRLPSEHSIFDKTAGTPVLSGRFA